MKYKVLFTLGMLWGAHCQPLHSRPRPTQPPEPSTSPAVDSNKIGIGADGIMPGYEVMQIHTLAHNRTLLVLERPENRTNPTHYQLPILLLRDEGEGAYCHEGTYITAADRTDCPSGGFDQITVDGDSFSIEERLSAGRDFIYSCVTFTYDASKSAYVLSNYSLEYLSEYPDSQNPGTYTTIFYPIKEVVPYRCAAKYIETLHL